MPEKNTTPTLKIKQEWFAAILAQPRRMWIVDRKLNAYWLSRLKKMGSPPFRLRLIINAVQLLVPEATIQVTKVVKNRRKDKLELHLGQVIDAKLWDREKEVPHATIDVAYHEAGHAVALVVVRQPGYELTIIPNKREKYQGQCLHLSVVAVPVNNRREQQKVARDQIVVAYAGWEAHVKFDPSADEGGCKVDRANAFELSRQWELFPRNIGHLGSETHRAYLERFRAEARRLINRHWPAVVALAEELYKRKHLDWDVVVKIVRPMLVSTTG
jgi:hypothetical protein